MDYVKIEKTKETLKSLKIRWANMLKNLMNQEKNIFNIVFGSMQSVRHLVTDLSIKVNLCFFYL